MVWYGDASELCDDTTSMLLQLQYVLVVTWWAEIHQVVMKCRCGADTSSNKKPAGQIESGLLLK